MAYSAKGQKKYNEKTIIISASYRPGTDIKEGKRIKAYLEQSGQTANSYIKGLIKRDLDEKGYYIGGNMETDAGGNSYGDADGSKE